MRLFFRDFAYLGPRYPRERPDSLNPKGVSPTTKVTHLGRGRLPALEDAAGEYPAAGKTKPMSAWSPVTEG